MYPLVRKSSCHLIIQGLVHVRTKLTLLWGCFPSPLGLLCSRVYSEGENVIFTLTRVPSGFQLLDTKSTDRKQTLLHYISNVVKEKYQQVSLFYNELHYVEKAAAGTQFQLLTLLLGVNALSHGGTIPCVSSTSQNPSMKVRLKYQRL